MDLSEWDMRLELLRLQQGSVLWDDASTEDAILHAEMTEDLYERLKARLLSHRARPDMRGVYTQSDMARFLSYIL